MGYMGLGVLFWDFTGSSGNDGLVQDEATVENINPPWSGPVFCAGQWEMYTEVPRNSPKWLSCTDNPSWCVSKGVISEVWELILGHDRESNEADVIAAEPGST